MRKLVGKERGTRKECVLLQVVGVGRSGVELNKGQQNSKQQRCRVLSLTKCVFSTQCSRTFQIKMFFSFRPSHILVLLRYNSHVMFVTHLKFVIQWLFSIFSRAVQPSPEPTLEHSHCPIKRPDHQ